MEEYRICKSCPIHHIENCRTCFGFGIYDTHHPSGNFPVSADVAHGGEPLHPIKKCPKCGSDERGYIGK